MESTAVDQSIWNKIFKGELEVNRFGLIAVLLLIIGCLGGVTVGLGAIESTVQLTLVVVPTMTALTLLLTVAPMKYIMTASAIAIDLLILLINFI